MSRIYTLAEVSSMMQQDYPAGASVLVARLDPSVLEKIDKGQICVNFYTLVLVQKGRMSYALKGNIIELEENDLVLVPPNYPVSYDSYSSDLQAVNLMIEEDYYHKVLQFDPNLMDMEYSYAYDLLPVFHLDVHKAEMFVSLSKQIQSTIRIPHLYREEMTIWCMWYNCFSANFSTGAIFIPPMTLPTNRAYSRFSFTWLRAISRKNAILSSMPTV